MSRELSEEPTFPNHMPIPPASVGDDEERRQLLARQIPLAVLMFVLFNGVGALMEWHYFPQRAPMLGPLFAVEVAVCLITIVAVRRRPGWAYLIAIVSTYAFVVCMALYFLLSASPRTNCVFSYALVLAGLVSLYPWGWRWQLCASLSTFLGYALVAMGPAPALLPRPYAYFTLTVCTVLTSAGAAVLDRHRVERHHFTAALKASEAEFRGIFEALQDVFYRTDLLGMIQFISPSAQRYGYQPTALIGRNVVELYGEDPMRRAEGMRRLLEHGVLHDFELTMRAAGGTLIPTSVTAHLLFDENGTPVGLEGLARYITDRKRLDQQRVDFVATVTHDIKQPTTTIWGNVELLRTTPGLPSVAVEHVDAIARGAHRLLELVNNYLDAAKIGAGAISVLKRPTRIDEVLSAVCGDYEVEARGRGIRLEWVGAAGLSLVAADRLALERVFTNLLSNAMKFTPQGGCVMVSARQEGEAVVVTVADTGTGIAAAELPVLFDRYRQATVAHPVAGTGLGLFIVKSLVEAHGGTVSVQSTLGKGTSFVVRLPCVETPRQDTASVVSSG
ncbi:MAG: ATP-binding protein [Candidatus Binatia bacterium]